MRIGPSLYNGNYISMQEPIGEKNLKYCPILSHRIGWCHRVMRIHCKHIFKIT